MAKRSHKLSASRQRNSDTSASRPAMLRVLDRRIVSHGQVVFPCIPALAGQYASKLLATWASLGRQFSEAEAEQLRRVLSDALSTGYESSPHALLVVRWEAEPLPSALLRYTIEVQGQSIEDKYADWVKSRPQPLFGALPDAKVIAVAAQLGESSSAPVLDVGAGTGRNALALARLGHPTDAVELVPALCDQMRQARESEALPLRIIEADFLSPEASVEQARYRLVVLSEVVSHFRGVDQIQATFSKLSNALAPGGMLLFNAFLGTRGYVPDALAQQISYSALSSIFSRADLDFLEKDLPFERLSDESAHDFEKAHLPESAWPPTSWFVDWSRGQNVFDASDRSPPMELRWLAYRRK
jgi:SAM-dependent methyltransferase